MVAKLPKQDIGVKRICLLHVEYVPHPRSEGEQPTADLIVHVFVSEEGRPMVHHCQVFNAYRSLEEREKRVADLWSFLIEFGGFRFVAASESLVSIRDYSQGLYDRVIASVFPFMVTEAVFDIQVCIA